MRRFRTTFAEKVGYRPAIHKQKSPASEGAARPFVYLRVR